MSIDESVFSYVVKYKALAELQRHGVGIDDFVDEHRMVWKYLIRMKRDHDTVPSSEVLQGRFPDLSLPNVKKRDLPMLLADLRQRRKYIELLYALEETSKTATSYENVDNAIDALLGRLNGISYRRAEKKHLVDLFSEEVNQRITEEISKRHHQSVTGIPTGLKMFDNMCGGLHKQKMAIIIGRTGIGKSWLDLLFVATAVKFGATVILYPLEMNLYETAFRLYTIFSQKMFGADKVIKNFDLTMGKVNMKKVTRFLGVLEDKFKGRLYVADMGSLSDPYTNERIEAEVEIHKPDMFWVDYLTLLKPPGGKSGDDWASVRKLSNGIKSTAMKMNCIGGASAQVNREAMRANTFLPRLEHIAYGDSIGQDSDIVFSINRKDQWLYYSLVKNRGGPEIARRRMKFFPDEGILEETDDQEEEENE